MQQIESWIEEHVNLILYIEGSCHLEDTIETFINLIHEAAIIATPQQQQINSNNGNNVRLSAEIMELIANERRLRGI